MRTLLVVLALAGTAAADTYPTEVVARPLLLPASALEGGGELSMYVLDSEGDGNASGAVLGTAHARYGLGVAELGGGVTFLIDSFVPDGALEPDDDVVQAFQLGGRYGVLPTVSLGADGVISPSGDRMSGRLRLASKQRLGAAGGLELGLGMGADRWRYDTGFDPTMELVYVDTVVESEARIQAQVSTVLAVEGRARIAYVDRDAGDEPFLGQSAYAQDYGARLIAAVSRKVDVTVGFGVTHADGDSTTKTFSIALVGRRVP